MEEEKGSTSSSGSMQSCRTHGSSSTDDITTVQQKRPPGAQTLRAGHTTDTAAGPQMCRFPWDRFSAYIFRKDIQLWPAVQVDSRHPL